MSKSDLCCKCHQAPRHTNGYCKACNRIYQREYARRKRGAKPRPQAWRALEENEKYCPKCDRILDRSRFSMSASTKDGFMSWCKGCDAFKQASYRAKNKRRLRPLWRAHSAAFRAANPGYNARAVRRHKLGRVLEKLAS